MIFVKEKKAQIMILDVLIFIIIILIILSLQTKIFNNYFNNFKYIQEKINLLEKEYYIDNYLLDCNLLGSFNKQTNRCYKNVVDIKNIDLISKEICALNINEQKIIFPSSENYKPNQTIKRGIVYKNKFSILEVGFCE